MTLLHSRPARNTSSSMSAQHYVYVLSLATAWMLAGCSGEKMSGGTPIAAKQLDTGTPVALIAAEGDFALVETTDSERFYVNLGVLKSRNTATSDQEGSHTHVLSTATAAYADEPPDALPEIEPRPVEEISKEQLTLNRLYMTEKTHRHIIAPTNMGLFVDEVTGENVWPACTCYNPDCPKKGTDSDPHLFILFDRSKPPICPACVEAFQLSGAGQERLAPFLRWTRPYELEEKKRRVKQLDTERKRAYRAKKRSK